MPYDDGDDTPSLDDFGDLLDDLNDCGALSDWEVEFVDSMLKRREADKYGWSDRLSHKQCRCLIDIWRKRCG